MVGFSTSSLAVENWTAEIKWVYVHDNGVAGIYISDPRGAPTGASINCSGGLIYLGKKDVPVNHSFLSIALSAYAAGKEVRFGLTQNNGTCEASYIVSK